MICVPIITLLVNKRVKRDEDAALIGEDAEAQEDTGGVANELVEIIYQLTPAENCSFFKLTNCPVSNKLKPDTSSIGS